MADFENLYVLFFWFMKLHEKKNNFIQGYEEEYQSYVHTVKDWTKENKVYLKYGWLDLYKENEACIMIWTEDSLKQKLLDKKNV